MTSNLFLKVWWREENSYLVRFSLSQKLQLMVRPLIYVVIGYGIGGPKLLGLDQKEIKVRFLRARACVCVCYGEIHHQALQCAGLTPSVDNRYSGERWYVKRGTVKFLFLFALKSVKRTSCTVQHERCAYSTPIGHTCVHV